MALDFYPPSASEQLQNDIEYQTALQRQQSKPDTQPSETPIYKQRCERAMHLASMLADFAEFHDLPAPYQKSLAKLVRVLEGTE